MIFSINSSLHYVVSHPASILSSITCKKTAGQSVEKERLVTSREAEVSEIELSPALSSFQSTKIKTPGEFTLSYEAIVRTKPKEKALSAIADSEISSLPPETLPFLFPSRYCESDQFREIAGNLFGYLRGQLIQAFAVERWLRENLEYDNGASHESSSALDTFRDRAGVCRDFAHLGIALCRALTIPARYTTVYSCCLEPQDFHAVFEVFVGGRWYVLDGTELAPLNGMVRIGTGRDASDSAVATLFGGITGSGVDVDVSIREPSKNGFEARNREELLADDCAIMLA